MCAYLIYLLILYENLIKVGFIHAGPPKVGIKVDHLTRKKHVVGIYENAIFNERDKSVVN